MFYRVPDQDILHRNGLTECWLKLSRSYRMATLAVGTVRQHGIMSFCLGIHVNRLEQPRWCFSHAC